MQNTHNPIFSRCLTFIHAYIMNLETFVEYFSYLLFVLHVGAKAIKDNKTDFVHKKSRSILNVPQPRIVGGQDAEDNQFPYQVSIRLYNRHICGGSIIAKNYIVTAAHCVSTGSGESLKKTVSSVMTIHAGSKELNSGGVVIGVSQINVHPNYKNFSNDIAILKLSKSLEFSKNIKPIILATKSPKEGTEVVSSGWGRLTTNGATPHILQFNTLVTITNAECKRRIGNIPISMLCLDHATGNGVCSGDSGGPAVYNNQLVGVTNFIVGACGSNYPDGYARVSFFVNWIQSTANLK